MTITEKILASHAGRRYVEPGEIVEVEVDLLLANDITAPLAIQEVERLNLDSLFDPKKVVFVLDHFTPARDVRAAENCRMIREFSKRYGIEHVFEVQDAGIEHALLPERGLVLPGELVIGADSHTCTYGALSLFSTGVGSTDLAYAMAEGRIWLRVPETMKFLCHGKWQRWVGGKDLILHIIGRIGVDGANYKAMEFDGEAVMALSMDGRFTVANMVVEAGAKNGIFPFDEKTKLFLAGRAQRPYSVPEPDREANYCSVWEIDVGTIEPLVALPFLPSNIRPVREVGRLPIDQVVIGSCTNGRLEDLTVAAEIMRGKKVKKGVRCLVIPATQRIYLEALRRGYMEIFLEAGCIVCPPTCGPCLGGHMGVLASGERAVATTNRNFLGRMGHKDSEVYLASPAVCAASAIKGEIVHPEEVL
jgi:3-isopropylmalate/(R)-2-methylmalate dehydratase large subunit